MADARDSIFTGGESVARKSGKDQGSAMELGDP